MSLLTKDRELGRAVRACNAIRLGRAESLEGGRTELGRAVRGLGGTESLNLRFALVGFASGR